MDIIYESAENFIKLKDTRYHFIFVQNRKKHEIVLDFCPSDYRHAAGLHYIDDIVIENNPGKMMEAILVKTPPELTDAKLETSKKYKEVKPYTGSVRERVSDMRFIEECLDTSDFMRIYKMQPFGSLINAEYFIETYCNAIKAHVYIFIRKREESDSYVVISFFRKKVTFQGISTYWSLKEKITGTATIELYRSDSYGK